MPKTPLPEGMRIFGVIWFGQLVSTLGSGLTGFALGVWIYQETGSTTLFALNMLAYILPNLLISPLAGALVDRWDRRWAMILSDAGAGLCTLSIAVLLFSGRLEIWQVYLTTAAAQAFSTFQWPAYSAATTMLVPKEHLGRAGGLVQIAEAMSSLISPALAGILYLTIGLPGVILIDAATFAFAVLTLLLVRIPPPPVSVEGAAGRGSLLREASFGWTYIAVRQGLFGLLMVFAATNFLSSLWNPVLTPMVLELTTPQHLGLLASIAGTGMLFGTLVMSAWGGPKRRVFGVLGFMFLEGLFTVLLGLRPSLALITTGAFGMLFVMPIVNGSSQALWQAKVAPDIQGRVFAVRRMIAWSTMPLAYLIAGPLADRVFMPLLQEGGPLAESVGQVIGVGPGRGAGLLLIVSGLLISLVSVVGFLHPRIRRVDLELPDADTEKEAIPAAETSTPVPAPAD
jgi:MFS family permease